METKIGRYPVNEGPVADENMLIYFPHSTPGSLLLLELLFLNYHRN